MHGRVAALLELGAGFNPEFTGRENVLMYGTVLGLTRQEVEERFDDIAAFAEFSRQLRPGRRLSEKARRNWLVRQPAIEIRGR